DAEVDDTEDITASISDLRLSAPVSPRPIAPKFGAVGAEASPARAPAGVAQAFPARAPSGVRTCLRFSRGFEGPRVELTGWFCNGGPELVDRGMLACALDRLSLLAAGGEPKLATPFARAEIKRSFCGQNSVFLAATPKRN